MTTPTNPNIPNPTNPNTLGQPTSNDVVLNPNIAPTPPLDERARTAEATNVQGQFAADLNDWERQVRALTDVQRNTAAQAIPTRPQVMTRNMLQHQLGLRVDQNNQPLPPPATFAESTRRNHEAALAQQTQEVAGTERRLFTQILRRPDLLLGVGRAYQNMAPVRTRSAADSVAASELGEQQARQDANASLADAAQARAAILPAIDRPVPADYGVGRKIWTGSNPFSSAQRAQAMYDVGDYNAAVRRADAQERARRNDRRNPVVAYGEHLAEAQRQEAANVGNQQELEALSTMQARFGNLLDGAEQYRDSRLNEAQRLGAASRAVLDQWPLGEPCSDPAIEAQLAAAIQARHDRLNELSPHDPERNVLMAQVISDTARLGERRAMLLPADSDDYPQIAADGGVITEGPNGVLQTLYRDGSISQDWGQPIGEARRNVDGTIWEDDGFNLAENPRTYDNRVNNVLVKLNEDALQDTTDATVRQYEQNPISETAAQAAMYTRAVVVQQERVVARQVGDTTRAQEYATNAGNQYDAAFAARDSAIDERVAAEVAKRMAADKTGTLDQAAVESAVRPVVEQAVDARIAQLQAERNTARTRAAESEQTLRQRRERLNRATYMFGYMGARRPLESRLPEGDVQMGSRNRVILWNVEMNGIEPVEGAVNQWLIEPNGSSRLIVEVSGQPTVERRFAPDGTEITATNP